MNFINQLADWIIGGSAIYHLLMGFFCLLSGAKILQRVVHLLYKIEFSSDSNSQLAYTLLPLGLFAIWTGFMCGVAVFVKGDWIFYLKLGLAGLFLGRALARYFRRDLFLEAFRVTWQRSRVNIVINILLVSVLLMSALYPAR